MTSLRIVVGSTAVQFPFRTPVVPAELSYRGPTRVVAAVLACTILASAAAACAIPLTSSIFVSGVVTTPGDRKAIQHNDGGLVEAVLVKEGQEVAQGQALVILDGERMRSALLDARRQYCALRLEARRLSAASHVSRPKVESPDVAEHCEFPDLVELDRRSETERLEAYSAHLAALQATQVSLGAELEELANSREVASSIMEIDAKELHMTQVLERSGDSPKTHRMAAEKQLLGSKSDLSNIDYRIQGVRNHLTQGGLEADDFQKTYEYGLIVALERNWKLVSEAQARVTALVDQEAHLTIRSPVEGHVLGLTLHARGSIVQAGVVIMEVVPASSELIVEGHVRPSQAPTLATGQAVRVRAIRQNGRPLTLRAHLVAISADRLMDRQDNTFFVVQAAIDKDQDVPAGVLRPGLPADLIVSAGEQTALEAWFGSILFVLEGRG